MKMPLPHPAEWISREAGFDELLTHYRARADWIMEGMNVFLLLVCLALAPLNDTWLAALLIGVPTVILGWGLARTHPGALVTRLFMGASFMIFTGLIIHQNHGDIEAHFAAFGLVGTLLYYRDWRIIVAATVVIYLHHLVLGFVQTLGAPVYVFDSDRFWLLYFVHVGYFLPFIAMMVYLSIWLRREAYEDQHVIAMAQEIMQGNLFTENEQNINLTEGSLIDSVVKMKNRLLDLLRIIPVPAAVIRYDTETLVSVNEAWQRQLGNIPIGTSIHDTVICSIPENWRLLREQLDSTPSKLLDKYEIKLSYPNGAHALCEVSLILHEETSPVMAILTMEDITQRRETEKTMSRLAYHDMLTGLANRTYLYEVLNKAMAAWHNKSEPFAVAMVDLDGFKPINDQHGHDAGDEVLRVVAERLRCCIKDRDLIARLGGDEFLFVYSDCADIDQAVAITKRVFQRLLEPITLTLHGQPRCEVSVSASIGVAHITGGSTDIESLLKAADCAMYQAKQAGKCQVKTYQPDLMSDPERMPPKPFPTQGHIP